jgi:hypothetical protein
VIGWIFAISDIVIVAGDGHGKGRRKWTFSKKKMVREVEEETTAEHRSALIRYIILILSTSEGVLVYCVICH